ncbi:leucyl/phenylalanyl-tRNA--protein transferase [Campylobacter geochelonis]|uniref:Leucyl/phenylalanyl-tRNA--protein transferase n=1 Tax=Campylobacter geochelonis TaxID=1780362 RepID=A0A128ENI5_9BACT|nr:leucyl/phenylalanyl-tRNA--protein transferase [Campylobacter geochelonis]CZE47019.1 leucyl/phenylalanyl-tRNA--protein transferase [Campylobacter geochelonis]CZE47515.1 leucyl/phenylalanyl-tRNA--protein transferase [Campylobacter geochelonis]CZE50234.1 leucyl/phenylalanyl-tRNA--protein transferase [Campylobacter geochelonis]
MTIYYSFPNPKLAPDNAPLCKGGSLDINLLLCAYKKGIFPWFLDGETPLWWSPNPRAVLFPKDIKIHKSIKPSLKKYSVKFDSNFNALIDMCVEKRALEGATWLGKDVAIAYKKLANLGIAHSVEVYDENELIGGLYGLIFGRVFCGESMISAKKDASKVALIYLCKTLQKYDFLIDAQIMNSHLAFMGAKNLPRDEFLDIFTKLSNDKLNLDFKSLTPMYDIKN